MRTGRSRPTLLFALLGLAVSGLPFSSVSLPDTGSAPPPMEVSAYGKLPVVFEPNQGQTDPAVRFLTRGTDHTVYLTATGSLLSLAGPDGSGPTRVSMDLVGSNPDPVMEGTDPLKGKVNYLVGDDPAAWKVGIPTFAKVAYRQVYPGIDLVWYGRDGVLEYDFVVAPGADPTPIALEVSGAESLTIAPSGELVMGVPGGEVRQGAPVVFQEVDGARVPVEGRFVLTGGDRLSFEVPDYDPAWPLVIDPTLVYSTYFGGTADPDVGFGIAVDDDGHAYVAGSTNSDSFPATSPGLPDAFVVKLDEDGDEIVYLTTFGGSDSDGPAAIDVADGIAYVTGTTESTNFPTEDPSQPGPGGAVDGFVVKLDEDGGGFEYSTYFGGDGADIPTGIATDGDENAFITGWTDSTGDFPLEEEIQPSLAGGADAFVAKLDPDAELEYSTYLGGTGDDFAHAIAVDEDGAAYLAGSTDSNNFPAPPPAFQLANEGGASDAFVTKLADDGQNLEYSTYLGGGGTDIAFGIAVDDDGQAYVTGLTESDDFDTEFALQPTMAAVPGDDAFVTQFDEDGLDLVYSTYLGGTGDDFARAIAVDDRGNAYVVGQTASTDFFVISPAIQGTSNGMADAFAAKVNTGGDQLEYSTYLGGGQDDRGLAVAVDEDGNAYITGVTESTNFPTNNPLQDASASNPADAFIAKIDG